MNPRTARRLSGHTHRALLREGCCVDANEAARRVQERPARVARVDGGVRLLKPPHTPPASHIARRVNTVPTLPQLEKTMVPLCWSPVCQPRYARQGYWRGASRANRVHLGAVFVSSVCA